jgi:glycosyltransferase involved in cell wall biosynthesis
MCCGLCSYFGPGATIDDSRARDALGNSDPQFPATTQGLARSSNSLKVLHVLSYLSLRYGGPPHSVRTLTDTMVSLGLDAHCWGAGDDTDRNEFRHLGPQFRVFPITWPRSWFRSPELAKMVENEVRSFDLLHINEIWSYPLYVAAKLCRKRGKAYLITPRGTFTQPWRYNTLKKLMYLRFLGHRMLDGAACLHAITPAEVSGFREAGYRGPVTIVPNGVDPEEFAQLPAPEVAEEIFPELEGKRVVHYLSRLSPEKGLDQLIPAWADIVAKSSFDDCTLVLSGPDHRGYRSTVEGLIESCGLTGKVLLTGMVDGFKKKALISRSDVYVLPSYTEGFSVSVLENLAAGKPALITSACNFPDLAKAGAGIIVPPERDALAEGLRGLLDTSPEGLKQMGDRGRRLVQEQYRLDITARKLITVYRCILQGANIPLDPEPAPDVGI